MKFFQECSSTTLNLYHKHKRVNPSKNELSLDLLPLWAESMWLFIHLFWAKSLSQMSHSDLYIEEKLHYNSYIRILHQLQILWSKVFPILKLQKYIWYITLLRNSYYLVTFQNLQGEVCGYVILVPLFSIMYLAE